MSKNAHCILSQNLRASTSSLAPSSVFAVRWESLSSVSGYSVGSNSISWQIFVSRSAVMSLTLLWRIMGKPPLEQIIACFTSNDFPQAQAGLWLMWNERRDKASRKAPCWLLLVYFRSSFSHTHHPFCMCMIVELACFACSADLQCCSLF